MNIPLSNNGGYESSSIAMLIYILILIITDQSVLNCYRNTFYQNVLGLQKLFVFVNKVWPSFVKMLFWTSASLCTRAAIQFRNDVACVAWRFWLGALSNKGGRGQRNREEGAGATYFSRGFAARSRALRARISRLRRSCDRLDKTAMLRRLEMMLFV